MNGDTRDAGRWMEKFPSLSLSSRRPLLFSIFARAKLKPPLAELTAN